MLSDDNNEEPKRRRRGRPKGSKNKGTRKRQKRRDVNDEFAAAFGMRDNEEETKASEEVNRKDRHFGDDDFEMNLMNSRFDEDDDECLDKDVENEKEVEDDVVVDVDEEVVGFGSADKFDVCELLELAREEEEDKKSTKKTMKQKMKEIKAGCVGKKSNTAYVSSICDLLFFTFENDRNILHNYWIEAIKSFSYGITSRTKRETAIKDTIRKMLSIRNETKVPPPLKFEEYDPEYFLKYLLSLQNLKNRRRLGLAAYCGRRSALFHLFRIFGKVQSNEFKLKLGTLFKGLKRQIAFELQQGKGRIQTGKSPISFSLYVRLNELMLEEDTTESVFGRAFMTITWNLVCRASNTCSIHLHHLEWREDSLRVYFAHMKNDQTGERKRDPRHIYSNPHVPVVCPVLALSVYFSLFSISGTVDSALFPGSNQYKRFASFFEYILNKHQVEIKRDFGVSVEDLGVHSLRKGAATYISSGSTCAPPQVATNIRAGWTMGTIQDTYLRYEAAGDQYVGRVVTGLPICSWKFAVLPPQIVDCDVETCEEMIECCFPSVPEGLKYLARFLTVSILYHLDTLLKHVPSTHPLLLASFLTSPHLKEMTQKIRVDYAWDEDVKVEVYKGQTGDRNKMAGDDVSGELSGSENKSSDSVSLGSEKTMPRRTLRIRKATGIPSHVMLMADMQKFIRSQQAVLSQVRSIIKEEFDTREVGHTTFQLKDQVEKMLHSFETRVVTKIDTLQPKESSSTSSDDNGAYPGPNSTIEGGKWHHWKGAYRRVPSDWNFPNKMTLRTAMLRYYLTDHTNRICPLKYLTSSDVINCKNGRRNISNLHMLMKYMAEEARKKNIALLPRRPSEDEVNKYYRKVSGFVLSLTNNPRSETFTWQTQATYVARKKKSNKNKTSN